MNIPTTDLPAEIAWTLVNTDDWGGGLERTYRAENVEHAGCAGDVHLVHLHDPLGAIIGIRSYCATCDEDLTATPAAEDDDPQPCGESVIVGSE